MEDLEDDNLLRADYRISCDGPQHLYYHVLFTAAMRIALFFLALFLVVLSVSELNNAQYIKKITQKKSHRGDMVFSILICVSCCMPKTDS